ALLRKLRMSAMRIHEDRKAAARRPIDCALGGRCHPDRWMRALHGLRQHFDRVALKVRPLIAQSFLGPSPQHNLDVLPEPCRALVRRDSESRELATCKAASSAPVDAAAREHIKQRDLLG